MNLKVRKEALLYFFSNNEERVTINRGSSLIADRRELVLLKRPLKKIIFSPSKPCGEPREAGMESAVQTLLGSAGQLRGVGDDVKNLRDDVATMKALLLMHSEADDGAVDHFGKEWMRRVGELAFDAEDCIDDWRLRIKSRPNDGAGRWLKRLLGTLSPRRRLAQEIIALRARATLGTASTACYLIAPF
jgi:hypothetical protein